MRTPPSIILEGASKAADWIPYAKARLESMASDGTANYSPEKGINIVISRHGDVRKIRIQADAEEKHYFVGVPYDSDNISGWGAPYDEEYPNGTPNSFINPEVLLTRDDSDFSVERYPEYAGEFSDIQYGNSSWTSADGETILSWDGDNTPHFHWGVLPVPFFGLCCDENRPDNEWVAGYAYPGFVIFQATFGCSVTDYNMAQRVLHVESKTPTTYTGELRASNNIYKDGEILATINESGEALTGEYGLEVPVMVFGAAIQKVTEEDGSVTEYLIAMATGIWVGTYSSGKSAADYLFRAPMLDLTDSTFVRVGEGLPLGQSRVMMNEACPWVFNSTGTKAVRLTDGGVFELSIDDAGNGTVVELWAVSADFDNWVDGNPTFTSPIGFGDIDRWDRAGTEVVAVGYKDDIVRYAVEYKEGWAEHGITLDDPGVGCDTLTDKTERYDKIWFTFTDDPYAVSKTSENTMVTDEHHRIFSYDNVGGTNGTTTDPARLLHTYKKREMRLPIFIDCERDILIVEHTKVPANTHYYGQVLFDPAFLMDSLASPSSYTWEANVEMYIGGVLAYESDTITHSRRPGDCHETSRYVALDEQFACDQSGFQLYLSGNPNAQGDVYQAPEQQEISNKFFFCNVQTQTVTDEDGEGQFDILLTVRSKIAEGSPTDSFIARWDGQELTDKVDIPELLGINNDGVYANTGKI